METLICDELLQEIFRRLPPSSSKAVPFVCKRWLRLFRSSTEALSLHFRSPLIFPSILHFLSDHPFLSSLSLSYVAHTAYNLSPDYLLLSVAFSFPNLRHLELNTRPVYLPSVVCLSTCCPSLISLAISLVRPLVLHWLAHLRSLKDLSIFIVGIPTESNWLPDVQAELHLRSLTINGMVIADYGLNWLWRCCKEVNSLTLKNSIQMGDDSSLAAFIRCVKGLQKLELRFSTIPIFDSVLLALGENCVSLVSLVLYGSCSKHGLLQFLDHSRCPLLKKLELRLPYFNLDDDHLIAIANNFKGLSSLILRNGWNVTAAGVIAVVFSLGDVLEELALMNCLTLFRELSEYMIELKDMRNLKVLDLSYNERLTDNELRNMLLYCCNVKQLKLRACGYLTDDSVVTVAIFCKQLEIFDLVSCSMITDEAVESYLMYAEHLRQLHIEEWQISVAARTLASSKCIEIVLE